MKHYSLLLFLVSMLCACTTNESESNVIMESSAASCNTTQNVLQRHIDRISTEYIERQNVVLYTADDSSTDDKKDDDTKELKKDDNVATMDATGFMTGILADGIIGACIGGVVGSAPGSALGGAIDKVVAGISMGLIMSVETANQQNTDSTSNVDQALWDVNDWITTEDDDEMFDPDITGSNLGYIHNWLIRDLWKTVDMNSIVANNELSDELLIDYLSNNIERIPIYDIFLTDQGCYQDVMLRICNAKINIWEHPLYIQVIDTYFSTIRKLDSEKKFEYTRDVMCTISGSGISDEDVVVLNGTISTYYYSMLLWNMNAVNNVIPE